MKREISYYILGFVLAVSSVSLPRADNSAGELNVEQFLKENPTPSGSTQVSGQDPLSQPASSAFGGNSGLFAATNALLNKQTNKTAVKQQKQPLTPTIIAAPTLDTHTQSKVLPTQSQQQAQTSLGQPTADHLAEPSMPMPDIKIPSPEEINENSFEALKQSAFPLTPDQIKILHNMLDETQRATASEPLDAPPEPVSSSLMVNLSPGTTPPAIRLYRGFVSSLVFVDSTGAPWPVLAYDLGNPSAFNIAWNNKDNLLMVQALTSYNYGNLAVKLQDLDTPVMLTLVPGQRAVDYRVDLRIMERGPNAKAGYSGINLPAGASPILLNILDAIPPQGAKPLSIPESTAQAWLYEDKVYLRTAYTLLSPAWLAKLSSADGMNAYELIKTPLVLLSRHGKTIQTKIEGF